MAVIYNIIQRPLQNIEPRSREPTSYRYATRPIEFFTELVSCKLFVNLFLNVFSFQNIVKFYVVAYTGSVRLFGWLPSSRLQVRPYLPFCTGTNQL